MENQLQSVTTPLCDDILGELADCILVWGQGRYLCHTQILASRSTVMAQLISITLKNQPFPKGRLEIKIFESVPCDVLNSPYQLSFLLQVYSTEAVEVTDVREAGEIAKLADFFGAPQVLRSLESSLTNLAISHLQRPHCGSVDELCTLFELSMTQRLTRLAALLLPWVVQRLNRGPLADSSCAIWKDVQTRLTRLQNSMDRDIRALVLDMQWWSCGMPERCKTCNCRSGDLALVIHPSYLANIGTLPYLPAPTSSNEHNNASGSASSSSSASKDKRPCPRLPESYLSVSAHMAHVLEDGQWGMTPAMSTCGSLRPQ